MKNYGKCVDNITLQSYNADMLISNGHKDVFTEKL